MHRFVLAAALLVCAGCSSASSSSGSTGGTGTSGSVGSSRTGAAGGTSSGPGGTTGLTPIGSGTLTGAGAFAPSTVFYAWTHLQNGPSDISIGLYFLDRAYDCPALQALHGELPDAQFVELQVNSAAGVTPGTYVVNGSGYPNYVYLGSAANDHVSIQADADGGSITLVGDASQQETLTGHFDAALGDGGLSGTFTAPYCQN